MKKLSPILLVFFTITVFAQQRAITCYIENQKNTSIFIDGTLKNKKILGKKTNSNNTYHLFTHGRSGELLINGQWKNAIAIAAFLKPIFNKKNNFSYLNIYGCEFAKGEKGKKAITYLEKKLSVKINASTNITGKNGDWLLEVGAKKDYTYLYGTYKNNLQCINQGTTNIQDYDCDNVINETDLDDDNDGIKDVNENCINQVVALANNESKKWPSQTKDVTITANYTSTSNNISYRNVTNTKEFIINNQYPYEVKSDILLKPLSSTNSATLTFNFSAPITADEIGILILDMGTENAITSFSVTGGSATTTHFTSPYLVTSTDSYYQNTFNNHFTYQPSTGTINYPANTTTSNPSSGILLGTGKYTLTSLSITLSNIIRDDWVAVSLLPLKGCDNDFDNDGIPNYLDLDSDSDGCPDAIEGDGNILATNLFTNNYMDGGTTKVQQNLGTNSNANGIPTNGTQTIGSSQEYAVATICCQDASNYPAITDTDGDNIGDACDLDDDNDGILDVEECSLGIVAETINMNAISKTNGNASDNTPATAIFESATGEKILIKLLPQYSNYDTTVRTTNFNGANGVPHNNQTNIGYNSFKQVSTSPSGNELYWTYTITNLSNTPIKLELDWISDGNYANPTVTSDQTNITATFNNFDTSFISGPISGSLSSSIEYTANGNTDIRFSSNSSLATNASTTIEIKMKRSGAALNTEDPKILVKFFGILPCNLDTDNDGIPNKLDLDSDGDGCPDAIEGGADYNASDHLSTNTNMDGGNTISSYTGTAGPIQQNLGTNSNPDGTPNIDGDTSTENESQTVGGSQDSSVNIDCCSDPGSYTYITDTDGDNIADTCDLDDDNDGILDTDEFCLVKGGLKYELYDGLPSESTVDNIPTTGALGTGITSDFDLSAIQKAHDPGDAEFYSIRYSGYIEITQPGEYTFYLRSDDGSKLFIEDTEVVNNDGVHALIEASGTINLAAGVYRTTLLYFQYRIHTHLFVEYQLPGTNTRIDIPFSSFLYGEECDTDNDGLVNRLDLDSDGDGCPDAIEGGADYNATEHLFENTNMDGGNSGTNYNGLVTTAVQKNLTGSIIDIGEVDTNGVPTLGVQEKGESQILNTNTACCTDASNFAFITDSDGDNIGDACDLDDDNDGILDDIECPLSTFSFNWQGAGFTTNGITSTGGETKDVGQVTGNPLFNGINMTIEFISSNYPNGNPSRILEGVNSQIVWANTPGETQKLKITFSQALPQTTFQMVFDPQVSEGETVIFTTNVTGNLEHPITPIDDGIITSNTVSNPVGGNKSIHKYQNTGIGGFLKYNIVQGVTVIELETTQSTISPNTGSNNGFLLRFNTRPPCDKDNDNIPNYLDLDSDGDGCPDALEGDAGFISSQLYNSVLLGGNTNVTAPPVIVNLTGNPVNDGAVNSNGIPVIANEGQNVGLSQDTAAFINAITISENKTFCKNTLPNTIPITATVNATPNNQLVNFQWMISVDNGNTYTNATGAGNSGSTTPNTLRNVISKSNSS